MLRHAEELKQNPSAWMPWNYRDTLGAAGPRPQLHNMMIPVWPKRIVCDRAERAVSRRRRLCLARRLSCGGGGAGPGKRSVPVAGPDHLGQAAFSRSAGGTTTGSMSRAGTRCGGEETRAGVAIASSPRCGRSRTGIRSAAKRNKKSLPGTAHRSRWRSCAAPS
jgi:hypothetical protein